MRRFIRRGESSSTKARGIVKLWLSVPPDIHQHFIYALPDQRGKECFFTSEIGWCIDKRYLLTGGHIFIRPEHGTGH